MSSLGRRLIHDRAAVCVGNTGRDSPWRAHLLPSPATSLGDAGDGGSAIAAVTLMLVPRRRGHAYPVIRFSRERKSDALGVSYWRATTQKPTPHSIRSNARIRPQGDAEWAMHRRGIIRSIHLCQGTKPGKHRQNHSACLGLVAAVDSHKVGNQHQKKKQRCRPLWGSVSAYLAARAVCRHPRLSPEAGGYGGRFFAGRYEPLAAPRD